MNENFLKNFENSENVFENPTIGKSENIFDNIFPLGENILEFDKSEEKIPKILSAEKCVEISKSVSFLYDKSENLFKKNQRTREIEGKREFFKNFLILSEIANLTGKRNITENDEKIITEKWEEFKKISPNAKIIEKNLIFTTEYRENYEKFLKIMSDLLQNYNGRIYCDNDLGEQKSMEITRILASNLVFSSVFDEEKYFDETLKILEKFLETRKQKYMPNDKNHPPLVNAMTNLVIDGMTLSAIEMTIGSGENPEKFANLKKILTENNRWEEYKNLVWKQEFYYVQQNMEDFENEKLQSKFFIKSEFDEYLRHFYVEKMRRAGVENLPKTIFSDVEDLDEEVEKLATKYGDESFLGKMKLTQERNYVGKVLFISMVPTMMSGGYIEGIQKLEERKIKIFQKIP